MLVQTRRTARDLAAMLAVSSVAAVTLVSLSDARVRHYGPKQVSWSRCDASGPTTAVGTTDPTVIEGKMVTAAGPGGGPHVKRGDGGTPDCDRRPAPVSMPTPAAGVAAAPTSDLLLPAVPK